jgi:hypothetical protein
MSNEISRELFWECPECWRVMSDLEKPSLLFSGMPCLNCNGSIADYKPLVGFPKGPRPTGGALPL